jgi:galactokinase
MSLQSNDAPLRLLVAFQQAFPDQSPAWVVRAPGRELWLAAARSDRDLITIFSPEMESRAAFTLQSAKARRTHQQRPLPVWARYPAGVTLMLAQDGLEVGGVNMALLSGEPPGPRHDYALGMAVAALWHEINAADFTVDTLIEIVDRARRDYVDV